MSRWGNLPFPAVIVSLMIESGKIPVHRPPASCVRLTHHPSCFQGIKQIMNFSHRGFTLVELMVTLLVAAIVMGMAIPSFTTMMANNRSLTLANEFADTLSLARAQAVTRSSRVSICASSTGTSCAGDWKEGYIVFIDTATSDTAAAPVVGEVLKYVQKPKGTVEFTVGYGDGGGTATSFFRYTAKGTLARLSKEALTIKTQVTGCSGDYARKISITVAGQTIMQPGECSS